MGGTQNNGELMALWSGMLQWFFKLLGQARAVERHVWPIPGYTYLLNSRKGGEKDLYMAFY